MPRPRKILGDNPERISVRVTAAQLKFVRKLSGPPPHRPSDSEVIRQLLDDGIRAARKRIARC